MQACKINKVKKIIHISTDEIYGENLGVVLKKMINLIPQILIRVQRQQQK